MKFAILRNIFIMLLTFSLNFSIRNLNRKIGNKKLKDPCTLDKECASQICDREICVNGYDQPCSDKEDCVSNNCNFSTKKCGVSPIGGYCVAMNECESEICDIPNKQCNIPLP